MTLAAVARIVFANYVGVWFWAYQHSDGALLFRYSLPGYYSHPTESSLMKVTGYPWLLRFVRMTHTSYPTIVAIFWIAAALVVFRLVLLMSKKPWLGAAFYLYVLFFPTAFEANIGTQLYRNGILIPLYLFVLALALVMMYEVATRTFHSGVMIAESALLSVVFVYTYWVKEDGLWLLAVLCAVAGISVAIASVQRFRDRKSGMPQEKAALLVAADSAKQEAHVAVPSHAVMTTRRLCAVILAAIIPLASVGVSSVVYKSINKRYFGVYLTNTRTSGELGKFVTYLYGMDAKGRSISCWAPADAIRQAFEASPTLAEHPDLYDAIIHTPWIPANHEAGDDDTVFNTNIGGDIIAWVVHTAIVSTGLFTSEKDVNDMFHQVNLELDNAFKSGKLRKSPLFRPTSSVGGYTWTEMKTLVPDTVRSYRGLILLHQYEPGCKEGDYVDGAPASYQRAELGSLAADALGLPYLADYSLRGDRYDKANRIIRGIFAVYRVLNVLLLLATCVALIGGIVRLARRKKIAAPLTSQTVLQYLMLLGIWALSLVYTLLLAWYLAPLYINGFSYSWANYDNLGTAALLPLGYAVAMCLLVRALDARREYGPAEIGTITPRPRHSAE